MLPCSMSVTRRRQEIHGAKVSGEVPREGYTVRLSKAVRDE
jgi:hypothetical protein